ncbi:MAG: hypothetical protein WDW36_009948 [Sanguina aurantia]
MQAESSSSASSSASPGASDGPQQPILSQHPNIPCTPKQPLPASQLPNIPARPHGTHAPHLSSPNTSPASATTALSSSALLHPRAQRPSSSPSKPHASNSADVPPRTSEPASLIPNKSHVSQLS